jgi:hypothetical protein
MSRKLEQNILPHDGRQVHAVVNDGHVILPSKGQMASPVGKFDVMLEGLQAADALAFQHQVQVAPHQQAILQPLDLQFVLQRVAEPDHLVARVNIQLGDGQTPFQAKVTRLQLAQIDNQRHITPR